MISGVLNKNSNLALVDVNIKTKAILYDASKCTACRGCQGACKQWHDLPAEKTRNWGSYQNPKTLSEKTWLVIRFDEHVGANRYPVWLFNRQSCFHCEEPDCATACPTGAMIQRKDGVVFVNYDICIGCGSCVDACPFHVPHVDKETEKAYKCNLCIDRIDNGLYPACVGSCPTGALLYGDRVDLEKKALNRVKELKEKGFSEAIAYGVGDYKTNAILVLTHKPEKYSWIPAKPQHTQAVELWNIFNPLGALAIGATALGALFHYIAVGPKRVEDAIDKNSNNEEK